MTTAVLGLKVRGQGETSEVMVTGQNTVVPYFYCPVQHSRNTEGKGWGCGSQVETLSV